MARALSFFISYFSYYYTLHRSDLAARAAPLDPRLLCEILNSKKGLSLEYHLPILGHSDLKLPIENLSVTGMQHNRIRIRKYFHYIQQFGENFRWINPN